MAFLVGLARDDPPVGAGGQGADLVACPRVVAVGAKQAQVLPGPASGVEAHEVRDGCAASGDAVDEAVGTFGAWIERPAHPVRPIVFQSR